MARYVRRCDDVTGIRYTGTGRWGMASYRAMRWLYERRVYSHMPEGVYCTRERQSAQVESLFYGKAWH